MTNSTKNQPQDIDREENYERTLKLLKNKIMQKKLPCTYDSSTRQISKRKIG